MRGKLLGQVLLSITLMLSTMTGAAQTAGTDPQVTIKTSEGDITVRLFKDKAPLTVANFLGYVDSGFYNGTIFHRVIPNFMIQGGGFLPDMSEKETGSPVENESRNRLHNTRGTLAASLTQKPSLDATMDTLQKGAYPSLVFSCSLLSFSHPGAGGSWGPKWS